MNAIATGIAYIVLWAALVVLLALIYWLWVVLVLDPIWMWQERRRREAEAADVLWIVAVRQRRLAVSSP